MPVKHPLPPVLRFEALETMALVAKIIGLENVGLEFSEDERLELLHLEVYIRQGHDEMLAIAACDPRGDRQALAHYGRLLIEVKRAIARKDELIRKAIENA